MGFTEALQALAPAMVAAGAGLAGGPRAGQRAVANYQAGRQMRLDDETRKALNLMAQHDDPFDAMGSIQAQGLQVDPKIMAPMLMQQYRLDAHYARTLAGLMKPSWGTPKAAIGPDGKPTFIQSDRRGGVRQGPGGYSPEPRHGVTVSPDGTIQIGGSGAGMTKGVRTQVQKDLLSSNKSLMQIESILSDLDASLQTVSSKWGAMVSGWKDKLNVSTGDDKRRIQSMSIHRAKAFEYLNSELNRLSGAAVTEHEMKRLKQSLPNPGTGVFDGDSPTEFVAKARRSVQALKMTTARLNYIRKHGFTSIQDVQKRGGHIPLMQIPEIMHKTEDELTAQYKARYPQATTQQIEDLVAKELTNIFGLRF